MPSLSLSLSSFAITTTRLHNHRHRPCWCWCCSPSKSPREAAAAAAQGMSSRERAIVSRRRRRSSSSSSSRRWWWVPVETRAFGHVPPPLLEDLSPMETMKESFNMIATSFATTVTIWGAKLNPRKESYAFDDDALSDDGGGGNKNNNNNNNNGGDFSSGGGDWGEENDGLDYDESQFVWIRNGREGIKWLASFLFFSWYCFFLAHEPFWGCVWLLCAIGTGWGLFLVGSAVSGVLFVTNFFYRVYDSTTANVLSESKEKTGGVIDYGIGIKKEAIKMIQAERFRKTIPEPIENLQSSTLDRNLNPNLPKNVSLFGTDAQIVQMKLKPGESINAEPGAMCYMSSNVLSITSLGPGGLGKAIARVLAGEPFFINTFRNLGSSDGYIALGSLRQGDKIAVVNLKEREADLLCARDSYLCSMGDISVSAAVSFSQEARGGRTLSQVLKQRFRTAVRLILSKGNNIFNGEWLVGVGTVCITGKGTVMRRTLREGEEMVVDARAVLALERTVEYDLELVSSPVAAVFGGEGLFHVRLKGPGGFYLQSLPIEQGKRKLRLGGRNL